MYHILFSDLYYSMPPQATVMVNELQLTHTAKIFHAETY